MGRHKKYLTDEQKKQANREKVMRYYFRNKEKCDQKSRDRYWQKKLANANNGATGSLPPVEENQLQSTEEQTANVNQPQQTT